MEVGGTGLKKTKSHLRTLTDRSNVQKAGVRVAFIDEKTVLDFYLQQLELGRIQFFRGRDSYKTRVAAQIEQLRDAQSLHARVAAAKELWKTLFEAAMIHIDPDKRGYDDLFAYFDEYVAFEELIFASDAFYRDHTLHCLWVYFLEEYLLRKGEFDVLFAQMDAGEKSNHAINEFLRRLHKNFRVERVDSSRHRDAVHCVAALTHDLGYPVKKIFKINKNIGRVLPYFSIQNYDEFNFRFTEVQGKFIDSFLDALSKDIVPEMKMAQLEKNEAEKVEALVARILRSGKTGETQIDLGEMESFSDEEVQLLRRGLGSPRLLLRQDMAARYRFAGDLEDYRHGIMSAFLLCKTIRAFISSAMKCYDNGEVNLEDIDPSLIAKLEILGAVSNHSSPGYQLNYIADPSALLTVVDELEEFSRISRADQNRQYVEEFCRTRIEMEGAWLAVDFLFDNAALKSLDPERAFRDKCRRFLSLFDIPRLDPTIAIRLRYIAALPRNSNVYTIEIARRHVRVLINEVEQDIPQYLGSHEFHTSAEYRRLGMDEDDAVQEPHQVPDGVPAAS